MTATVSRRRTGRDSLYTPERVQRIVNAIRMGATYKLACKYGGIVESTFYRWKLERKEFSDAVQEAEGAAAVGWLAKIEQAANDGTWQAAAWKLERRYPSDYGRTSVEVSGRDGGPLQIEVADPRVALLAMIEEATAASLPSGADTVIDIGAAGIAADVEWMPDADGGAVRP